MLRLTDQRPFVIREIELMLDMRPLPMVVSGPYADAIAANAEVDAAIKRARSHYFEAFCRKVDRDFMGGLIDGMG